MLSTERILGIIAEETKDCSPEVQRLRDELVDLWRQWNAKQIAFCIYARDRIDTLPKRGKRQEGRRALRAVKDRISFAAVEEALTEEAQRQSANRMKLEILRNYEVINRQGRGVVYLGSARLRAGTHFYELSRELGREVYQLLGCTSWTGAGPGIMEAPLVGAREVGGKTAGIKILLNGEESSFEQDINPALAQEDVGMCQYFGPRKIGLADAAMRNRKEDRTAIITLPGGFGTLDEFFEYVVLKQLKKLGSRFPVPILLMNYDGFYNLQIEHLNRSCVETGTIADGELSLFHVCDTNREALEILAETYDIPPDNRTYRERLPERIVLRPMEGTDESVTAG